MRFMRKNSDDEATVPDATAERTGGGLLVPGLPGGSVPVRDAALTGDQAKGVRFTISEPRGYYFPQVEAFVQQVVDALTVHENNRYEFERALHQLQVELEQQAFDNQRLRTEIEVFKVNGNPLVNDDGSYVTESQQQSGLQVAAQVEDLTTQVGALQQQLVQAEAHRHQQETEIASLRAWGESLGSELEAARAAATAVEAAPAVAPETLMAQARAEASTAYEATVVDLTAQVAAAARDAEARNVAHADLTKRCEALTVQVQTLTQQVEDLTAEKTAADAQVSDLTVKVAESEALIADLAEANDQWEAAYNALAEGASTAPADEAEVVDPALANDEPVVMVRTRAAETTDEPVDEAATNDVAGEDVAGEDVDADGAESVVGHMSVTEGFPENPADDAAERVEPDVVASLPHAGPEADAQATAEETPDVAEAAEAQPPAPEPAPAEAEQVHPAPADDDEDKYGTVVAVVPIESELPPGTPLPGTGEAAITYPPAAPGVPLNHGEVPMHVWAPELDPRVQAAAAEMETEYADDEDDVAGV